MAENYFLKMIKTLRIQEEIILYGNILHSSKQEDDEVVAFLDNEYAQEALDFPRGAPGFDPEAARWAATTVYTAAQLMLYRENKGADLKLLLPDFQGFITPAAMVSADLCLRFLPDMVIQLKIIDHEDPLIEVLERILTNWHYSGIKYNINLESIDLNPVVSNSCMSQLYVNRVIAYKKIKAALHPALKDRVQASLGIFATEFWNAFKTEMTIDEQHKQNQ